MAGLGPHPIVVDLGFGDAGKGRLTDRLVRERGARWVVRYNGGPQAGHNVVTADGRHHTFAQVGAGTFVPGVGTWLAREMLVHPTALLREAEVLANKGVPEVLRRLRISARCGLVTPFHQAMNRLRELARGPARHGSCGAGVGETRADQLAHPADALSACDLTRPAQLRQKAEWARQHKLAEARELVGTAPADPALREELAVLAEPEIVDRWIAALAPLVAQDVVREDDALARELASEVCVFEGAQGVLLDQDFGFHPHTTWSRCTPAPARELLAELAPGVPCETLGILRCYHVRHGPGPLPTETHELDGRVEDHNQTNPWQGRVRYGWFDAVLARYALACVGGVDRLVISHLDALPKLAPRITWHLATAYRHGGEITPDLPQLDPADLAAREALTRWLGEVEPVYEAVPATAEGVLAGVHAALLFPGLRAWAYDNAGLQPAGGRHGRPLRGGL